MALCDEWIDTHREWQVGKHSRVWAQAGTSSPETRQLCVPWCGFVTQEQMWPFWQVFQCIDTKNKTFPNILKLSKVSQLGTSWIFSSLSVWSCSEQQWEEQNRHLILKQSDPFSFPPHNQAKISTPLTLKGATVHPCNLRNTHSTAPASFHLTPPLNFHVPSFKNETDSVYVLQSSWAGTG